MIRPSEYFLNLIDSDPKLKPFKNDLGLQLLARDLEYKVDETNKEIIDAIKEIYYPTKEETLLAHLLYRVGYLRFKKPLKIICSMLSNDAVNLNEDTRFTDGNYVYYLDNFTHLEAQNPKDGIILTLKEKHTIEQKLETGSIFGHIELPITYKECIGIRCFIEDKELKYSQNFVDWDSDFSIEVLTDTYLQVVFKYNDNVKLGDTIRVVYETSFDVDTAPDGLTIIETGYDLIVDSIRIYQNYEPPMSIEDMQYLVKYHRKNIGDFVVNEDFRQLFLKEVAGLKVVKVWQQKEETRVSGFVVNDTNKVFVSYITDKEEIRNTDIDERLKEVFYSKVYGRDLVIRDANIVNLNVTIDIKTNDPFTSRLYDELKQSIVGYYDDVQNKINETEVTRKIIPILNDKLNIYQTSITLNGKTTNVPRNIYNLDKVNIFVNPLEQ